MNHDHCYLRKVSIYKVVTWRQQDTSENSQYTGVWKYSDL